MKTNTRFNSIMFILTFILGLILLGATNYKPVQASAETSTELATGIDVVIDETYTYYIKVDNNQKFIWLGEDGVASSGTGIEYESAFNTMTELDEMYENDQDRTIKEGHIFEYFVFADGVLQGEQVLLYEQVSSYGINTPIKIYAAFKKESGFEIYWIESLTNSRGSFEKEYGENISDALNQVSTHEDFIISGWKISNTSENNVFEGTKFAIGNDFIEDTMPDLSVGEEKDGGLLVIESITEQVYFNVTLKTAYGTVSPASVKLRYGDSFILPVPSNVAGREFLGWCLNSLKNEHRSELTILGTPITDENGQSLSTWQYQEEVTLDAAWHTIAYQITCDLNGGNYPEGVTNLNWYMVDDLTITLSNPTRSGYKFMGWKNDDTGEISITTRIPQGSVGDKNYTAQWAKLYTISFDSNYGSSCDSITIEENATITLPTSTRVGYTGTWGAYGFGTTYTVTKDETLVAVWTGNIYTITFDNNGGTDGPTTETVQFGEALPTIVLPTREGYWFHYYEADDGCIYYANGGTEVKTYYHDEDIRLTAQWVESFLIIENLGKSGTKWSIKITNNSSTAVTVYYNKKMCYLTDAKNWTGLKDVNKTPIEIISGGSATVTISENWFATSITVSYVTSDGVRRITYADGLTTSGGMNVKTNKIT